MQTVGKRIEEAIPTLSVEYRDKNLLLYPVDGEEVSAVVRFCNESRIPLIPVGGGNQIKKGPDEGAIYLCTRKMNTIIFQERDMTMTVETGVTSGELAEALQAKGIMLPLNSIEKPNATLGGLLAGESRYLEQYGYGPLVNYLLGLEFVTPTGERIRTGGKTVKNVTGYDFTRLFTKSWGTLGIITKATFKLLPLPQDKAVFITQAPSLAALAQQMQIVAGQGMNVKGLLGFTKQAKQPEYKDGYLGIIFLAGSHKSLESHGQQVRSLVPILSEIHGLPDSNAYLQGMYQKDASAPSVLFGTDRRTMLEVLPEVLDRITTEASLQYRIDFGSGAGEVFFPPGNEDVIKASLREAFTGIPVHFNDDPATADVVYWKLKKGLDPNRIMYPYHPRIIEVS